MRHRKSGVKLNRTTSHRQAMFRNMVTSLLKHDKIKTTAPKAKELRRWADHIITLAKRGDLHARRQAMSIVREKAVVHKLFEEAAERFGTRNGGYTRIVKIGRRSGDAAPLTIIELLGPEDGIPTKSKKAAPAPVEKTVPAEAAQEKEEVLAGDTAEEAVAVEETAETDEVTETQGEAEAETEDVVEEPEAVDTSEEATETEAETSEKPKKTEE